MSFSRVFAPLCAAFLGLAFPAFANPLDKIEEEDREALEALAVYPEDVRNEALEVATEAGVLVDLQNLQEDSQKTFRDLLEPYAQSDQEELFELSRYPDLVEEIARSGKSRGDLERIASGYPEDVRAAVVRQGGERHRVVTRMHALLEDFDHRFDELVDDLPIQKQRAFRTLLGTPELLSLMSEHTDMTVLLGDAYERDPGATRDALSELNLEVARRNAEEADDWKKTVDSDPDLRRDYDSAANDYRNDTGYDAYQGPRTVVNVSVNPYPYWFGYPWWYPVSYTYYDPWYWWYPRRTWGHCGYSYGPRVVFYGGGPFWRPWYPSYHFTSWYFSYGHHHGRYPYLSDRFVSYYDRPVHVSNHYHYNVHRRVVRKFEYETNHVLPADYWRGKSRKDRVERFREYGKIAPELEKVRGKNRQKEFEGRGKRPGRDFTLHESAKADTASRDEVKRIVAKNPKAFPELAKVKKEDWDRPRDRDRDRESGKRATGQGPLGGDEGGKGKGSRGGDEGGKGKDRAARPSAEPGDGGKGKGAGQGQRGGDEGKGADQGQRGGDEGKGKRSGGGDSGKARPSFESPSGEKSKGGGGGGGSRDVERGDRDRGNDRGGKSFGQDDQGGDKGKKGGKGDDGRDRRARETKAAPSFDAPSSSGGGERSKSKAERRSDEPRQKAQPSFQPPRDEAPRVRQQEPRYEAPRVKQQPEPRYEQPRAQEREYRGGGGGGGDRQRGGGGGGGDRQRGSAGGGGDGGGDGGGKNRKDKNPEEEDQGGGGGGGGGGKRGR